ncbi:MAG TPA: glycosyltransferase family 39 protein [Herpetosiphonaceae bacterium]
MKSLSSSRATRAERLPREAATQRRTAVLLVGAILIGALLLRMPGLALPLERDEGAYAYVAWTWLQGGLPYRDAFDHKPPLIYLLYMPPLLFGPPSAWAIRVWATLLFLVDVALVCAVGNRVWSMRAALLAALIFAVAGSAFDLQGLILNTDQALVLPTLIALWCAIRLSETQRLRFAIGAGAALAATMLIKPVAIVLIPALLLACWRNVRSIVRVYAGAALGALLVGLPIAGYFALRGGWSDLVFGVLTYNTLYAGESQARWQLGPLVDMFAPFVPLLLTALGGIALLRPGETQPIRPLTHRAGWLVVGWAAALLIAALGSLRAYIHYYYPLLPFLALLAAPCILRLWADHRGTTPIQRGAAYLAAALLGALLLAPLARQNLQLLGTTAEQQAERLYGEVGKHYFAQAPLVADYIRERTQPDDYVYIFAAEPEVYLLSERRASSRYIYDYPLRLVPGASAELLRDLAARPPRLVITYYGVRPDGFYQTVQEQQFVKLAEIGGYEIFGVE